MPPGSERCRAHPARLAYDECPACGRARCRPDAESASGDCVICRARRDRDHSYRTPLERLVRGALAAAVAVPLCGAVATQHLDAGASALVAPVVSAVVVAEAVLRGAGRPSAMQRELRRTLRALAVVAAVLASAAAFAFEPGKSSVVEPLARVLPAYGVAALTAAFWARPGRR